MFERFTDRARRSVILSQEEARQFNSTTIGTEHILLGLISEGEGVAAQALIPFGITLDAVRNQIEKESKRENTQSIGHLPYTPQGKRVLELSLRESLRLGHNFIGTEHLLLGIIREGSDTGYQILEEMVAGGTHTVYGQVMMLLNGYKSDPPEYETTENSLEGMRKTLTGIRQNVDSLIEHIDTMQQRKDTA